MIIRNTGPVLHLGRCHYAGWTEWLYRIRHQTRSQRGLCSQGRTLYFDSLAVLKRKRELWHRDGARLLVKVPLRIANSTSDFLLSGGFKKVVSISGASLSVESSLALNPAAEWANGCYCEVANSSSTLASLKIYQCLQQQCDLTPVPLWVLRDCHEGKTLILRDSEGKIAGGATVVFFRNVVGTWDFLLFGMFVVAAHRGRGFGKRLLSQLLGLPEVSKSRTGFIMLEKEFIIEFYARFGFMAADHFCFLYCDGYSTRVK
ncbi:GNAT family N-acetyltransferase [Pseudomonas syringae group genomosp. 7]|uniref:GNAT family N-acetyltransferase n=1 Tax=Pseudomonas syringae group genomosp. 7 TaxID=251699 RepID=UPI000ADA3BA0|nr:GNAT family N-acetyltransferase [Pseudomonas syringae group genomosp. 7]UNB68156.1 GNAT family N-acetyltransferase [Pseudomonas syringae pv. tagetis]